MNFKSITTLGLVAVALAVTSLTPAQASNNANNKALNQLAMQYYMQNQAASGNMAFNPLLNNGAVMPANYTTYGVNPWAAGAVNPYAANAVNPYSGQTPWSAGCTGLPSTAAYGNIIAPQYNSIANKIASLQGRLAVTNPNSWTALSLQKQINRLQAQENSLAANGYGAPYGYNSSILNNLRGFHL